MKNKLVICKSNLEQIEYVSQNLSDEKNVIFCPKEYRDELKTYLSTKMGILLNTSIEDFVCFGSNELLKNRLSSENANCKMQQIIDENLSRLSLISGGKLSKNCGEIIVDTIKLLKSNAIDFKHLKQFESENEVLNKKIKDLSFLYEKYQEFLQSGYCDEVDCLNSTLKILKNDRTTQRTNFYVFGYSSFSKVELKIIDCLFLNSKSLTLLCNGGKSFYSNIILNQLAKLDFEKTYFEGEKIDEVKILEENLFYPTLTCEKKVTDRVVVNKFADEDEEVEYACAKIKELLYEGEKADDICLTVTSLPLYEGYIKKYFQLYNIPLSYEYSKAVISHPFAEFWISVFDSINSLLSSNCVYSVLSNPFFATSEDSSLYENYLLKYANFMGGIKNQIKKEVESASLFEELREKFLEIVSQFNSEDTLKNYVDKILTLTTKYEMVDANAQLFFESRSKFIFEGFDKIIKILNSLAILSGDRKITLLEFTNLIKDRLSKTNIKLNEKTRYAVTVKSIDEPIVERKKYLLALGFTLGYPVYDTDTSFLCDLEREELSTKGINIFERATLNSTINLERTCLSILPFSERLYLSMPKFSSGEEQVESEVVTYLLNLFEKGFEKKDLFPSSKILPNKFASKVTSYLNGNESDKQECDTLYFAMQKYNLEKNENAQEKIDEFLYKKNNGLEDESTLPLLKELLLKSSNIAPTTLEGYFGCPYKTFCDKGLKLSTREEKNLMEYDYGNFTHEILQDLAEYYKSNSQISVEECGEFAKEKAMKLLSVQPYSSIFDLPSGEWTAKALIEENVVIAKAMISQIKQSSFSILGAEVEFNSIKENEISKIEIDKDTYVFGKIDRVDEWQDYVRVIDYKTGFSKDTSITSYYVGKKLQLQLYLKALTSLGKKPAGTFYFPASVQYKDQEEVGFTMTGFYNKDEGIIKALDNNIIEGEKSKIFDGKIGDRSSKGMTDEEFNDFIDYSLLVTKQAVREIREGFIKPSPYKDACMFCSLQGMCMFDDGISGNERSVGEVKKENIIALTRGKRDE